MISRFVFRLFLGLFARRIVRAAYQGILGRAPDAEGLAAYEKALLARRDLAGILGDLATSDEARRRAAAGQPEALVHSAFQAVLGRPPRTDEFAAQAAKLKETRSIEGLLADLAASRAGAGRFSEEEAAGLVRAAFRALLHREPEPEALATYKRSLLDTGDVERLLADVGHSQEHRERLALRDHRARAIPRA